MGKALKPILIGTAIIGVAVLTGGVSLVPTLSVTGATAVAGTALSTTFLGGLALSLGAAEILSGVGQMVAKKPQAVALSSLDRLQASLNPTAPRTMVFGRTAMATDIRYVEPSGANQEFVDYIICVAAHGVTSIEEIWLEDALAWTAAGGSQGVYTSFLSVAPILEGSASAHHTVNGGARWGDSQRLTGCANLHIRINRAGKNSPFVGGLPGRMTIIGKGLPLYDPRRDSTVPGGSGSMRANDQSTWSYAPGGTEIGQNLALQSLAYLLGWRINGKLSVGCGIPANRLDLAGFITAANLCDEPVTTTAGTQPRYHGAGLVSENDDPPQVMTALATACNGRFRESLGKLGLIVMHNDLALAAADPGLGDDEMVGGFTWNPDPSLEQSYNVVRGRYTNPSNASLYQLVDYPEVRLPSTDGIDRVLPLDLPWVQDAAMAQRIAKQILERKQYDRTLTVVFNMAGWAYKIGDPVPITLSALGMNRNVMRVEQQIAGFDGTCPMILRQESPAIYAWDADDRAPVTPATPIVYNPLNNPIIIAIDQAGQTAQWPQVGDPDGTKPDDNATNSADPNSPFGPDGTVQVYIDDLAAVQADLTVSIPNIFDLAQLQITQNAILQAKTTLEGRPIGTVVVDVRTVTEDTVETLSLIGAKNAAGTAFIMDLNTVRVTATQTLAQRLTQISATGTSYTDAQISAVSSNLSQAITTGDSALAQQISQVSARVGDTEADVSFLMSAVVTASGSTTAKAVLSVNAAGRIAGFVATNNGSLSTFDLAFDKTRIFRTDGTLLFQASGNTVYMPNVVVDTLEVNTAIVPVEVSATSYIQGSYDSMDGVASPRSTVLTAVVTLKRPGKIRIWAKFQQGFTQPAPWSAALAVNGGEIAHSVSGGGNPQDTVSIIGSYSAGSAGSYTITLRQAMHNSAQLRERVMFVDGYNATG